MLFVQPVLSAKNQSQSVSQNLEVQDNGQSVVLGFDASTQTEGLRLGFFGQTLLGNEDNGFALGYRRAGSAFSVLAGQGEGSEFSAAKDLGVDENYFHGGSFRAFSYRGADWKYHIDGSTHISVGYVQIDSDGLERRSADYLRFSNAKFSAAFTRVQRAEVNAAKNIELTYRYRNYLFELRQFGTKSGGQFNALGMSWTGQYGNQFGLSASVKSNSLLDDVSESRVMFRYQRKLGYTLFQDQTKEKKDPVNTGVLIGAAVVGVALIGSSGSDSQDNSLRFAEQHRAARSALNGINPKSVRENREYGGYIYRSPDGSYISTKLVQGEVASVQLPFSLIPVGGVATASFHTHGGNDPKYDNENFSFTDIASDQQFGVDGYLGTPTGGFLWHDQSGNRVVRLGTIAF